jgi:hypothetical protein
MQAMMYFVKRMDPESGLVCEIINDCSDPTNSTNIKMRMWKHVDDNASIEYCKLTLAYVDSDVEISGYISAMSNFYAARDMMITDENSYLVYKHQSQTILDGGVVRCGLR